MIRSARLFCLFSCIVALSENGWGQGFSAEEAVKRMKVADGFRVDVIANEPMVAQPVCVEFDDRGRLWVIQYLQYPNPAGLQRTKVDRFSRTKYDKVPEPPPRGPKGADRITILERQPTPADEKSINESANFPFFPADGSKPQYKAKDFVSGLNLASGLAFGHGGVFVLQVPYLLFYPDKNGDDIPDSDPEVLLTGFGMEDAHSVANSLTWGPDGWLYGCQGSTVTANIRGIEFQQGVWRYHPISKRFELFCEGGGNSWGIDFDKDGNIIYSTNFGGYRALHASQGGYFWKQFGKHGALHNPYAYGFIDHMPHENFVGGHVTVSGIIYQGDAFPEKFRNQYIHVDTLGHGLLWSKIQRNGSSFKTSHGGELLAGNDTWFAPCDATVGPDGALYFADWYDKRTAHPDPDADWDRSNGRIYRLQYAKADNHFPVGLNIRKLSSKDLVETLSDSNDWWVRKARRVLADRRDVTVYPKLRAQIFETTDEHLALESLWALYVSGGADEAFLNDCLDHSSSKIRYWAVRFIGDAESMSPATGEHLLKIAATEKDIMVRSQMASTAKRIDASTGVQLVEKVIRDADANDPQIPLLLWWALEKHCLTNVDDVVTRFSSPSAWQSSIISQTILPRLMRRYAAEGTQVSLGACDKLMASAPSEKAQRILLSSFEQGLREQTKGSDAAKLGKLPASLRERLLSLWRDNSTDDLVLRLLSWLGDERAEKRLLELASDAKAGNDLRVAMLQVIGEIGDARATNAVLDLATKPQPEPVQVAALDTLQQLPNAPLITLLDAYNTMTPHVRSKARDVLFGRKDSAAAFLSAIDSGRFAKTDIPVDQLQKIATFEDKQMNEIVRRHWGNIGRGTPEEKLADIRRFNNDLRAASGDPVRGREVFLKTCSVCHELFGEGEKVGPELTHANRQDKDFLLTSIVDPSAVIRKEFLNYNLELSDGRSLSGLIAEQSANSLTLIAAKNERTTIPRDRITSIQESSLSLMPEGLLHPLTPQERRDLFAYLQSEKPPVQKKAQAQSSMPPVRLSKNGKAFVAGSDSTPFVPYGFNYDRDYKMRLIEEYWDSEWQTVVEDFREMKQLGANVVRVHLQFAKFMDAANKANAKALTKLSDLLKLAEETGIYLDLTGLASYRKNDVPKWYESMTEQERWQTQAAFWEAVSKTCANSPAVFCYDLMNEPVVPNGKSSEWLVGELGGFYYVQTITRDLAGRDKVAVARQWVATLSQAIRENDKNHLITIGLLPNSADATNGPGFVPQEMATVVDFISVHLYPRTDKLADDLSLLKEFSVGKPVMIEEIFPMTAQPPQVAEFMKRSRDIAAGWIGFYWGQTPAELEHPTNITGVVTREWLKVFQQVHPALAVNSK